MAIKKGETLISRRSGRVRYVAGFTTKPDGVRRARLADVDDDGNETRVRVDNVLKNYYKEGDE